MKIRDEKNGSRIAIGQVPVMFRLPEGGPDGHRKRGSQARAAAYERTL